MQLLVDNALAQTSPQPFYQLSENFQYNNTRLFKGIEVRPLLLFADTTANYDISKIRSQHLHLKWIDAANITPQANIVYWLKCNIVVNKSISGKQIFQVVEELGNDLHAYDYIDTYTYNQQEESTHQRAGRKIDIEDKPVSFWANLIQLEVTPNDSLEVYIRLEGMNLSYPIESFSLWHLDFDHLFKSQLTQVRKSSLFNGILGIQVLFFFFLYLIERELIYISFSLFGLGILFTRIFTEFNFASYVPFPQLINHNELLFHLSVFLTVMGGLFFLSQFLKIPKNGRLTNKVIPIYAIVTLCAYLRFIFRHSFNETGAFPLLLTPAFYTFFGIFLGIYMIVISSSSIKRSKFWLLLAILPSVLGIFLILLNNDAHLTININDEWLSGLLNKQLIDDMFSVGVVILLMTLSLNVGYRSLSLKKEKNAAIKENLISKQTIFEKQLQAKKLEEMDELKTKLYTNITHEFRTPLTVIMGINDELSDTTKQLNLPLKQKEKFLQNQQLIHRNSENLLTLVNQLLDLSKSESQQLGLQLIQADVISYLNYLTESFFSKAKEKDIRLVFYSELSSMMMDYDEQKMQHIIYNLLSNAIKFTTANGKIIMHATKIGTPEAPVLQLIVKDTGIGIPEDQLPYIFDRFYQVDGSQTRQEDGSGIGLSLTKNLVELMGGNISVESQLEVGTMFTIELPITNQAEERALLASESEAITPLGVSDTAQLETANDATIDINPLDDQPILLIVEDNKDVFSYLKLVLGQTYQIIGAVNGQQGINEAVAHVPDLIISDVMMPIKDGYALTTELKEDTRTSHIPIILLTAKATDTDKLTGLKKGADAYLSKPFNKEELLVRIDQLLAIRNKLRTYYTSAYSLSDIDATGSVIEKQSHRQGQTKEELFLKDIRQSILKDIKNDDINGAYLAQLKGISQSQLYRKIRALTGDTPNSLIRDIRLQKSLALLKSDTYNISEVAYAVGFSNPSYFSRAFHKKYGQSPLTYRKSN